VIFPPITAWMKQRRHFAGVGIDASEIRPFVKVTFRAGEREIFGVVRAAMLPRNDMLNVKAKAGEVLGKAAILATGGRTGSSPHPSGGFGENGLSLGASRQMFGRRILRDFLAAVFAFAFRHFPSGHQSPPFAIQQSPFVN